MKRQNSSRGTSETASDSTMSKKLTARTAPAHTKRLSETDGAGDPEAPQHLGIKIATLRRLYLHSGNLCAFPGCKDTMMDEDGHFVGEICHIEAAKTGGERFRASMTDDERRSFKNLLLLCHRHHVVTNNVKKYPATKCKV